MSQNQAQGFKFPWKEVGILPVQWHALALGLFPSIIAPFGGFFASGFKHAFKIKDFRDSIPGHGGIINRMDCQITCESDENQTIGRVLEPCMLVASLLVRVASTPCDLRCDSQHSVQKPTPCDLRCDPHHSAQKPTRHESHPIHADRIRACRQFQTEPN